MNGEELSTFSERLKAAIERAELNQSGLARKLGISRPVVSDWATGKYRPAQDNLTKIADILNVSVGWLVTGEGTMDRPETVFDPKRVEQAHRRRLGFLGSLGVPSRGITLMEGKAAAGRGVKGPLTEGGEYPSAGSNARWVEVEGGSMEPVVQSGSRVLVDPELPLESGDLVLVQSERHGLVVKKLLLTPQAAFLLSLNPDPAYETIPVDRWSFEAGDTVVLGRVVGVFREV